MKKGLAWTGALLLAVAVTLSSTFAASPLPAPKPFDGPLPAANPPPGMAVFQLPTGVTHRSAGFAYRGGSFLDKRDFPMTAVLVRHPRGDLLIDTGFGRDIDTQFLVMPWIFRMLTSYTRFTPAAAQLDAAGYDRRNLRGILLTHAHWDHASGIPDFGGTSVLLTAEERRHVREGGMVTALMRSFRDTNIAEYSFDGGPYLGFPASRDFYGDGSIVIVPAAGHTPGSVIVFLALPDGKRYAMIGDLAWQREGISLREERPWLQRSVADDDPAEVRDNILRVAAIAARFPEIAIVPAHDARGFETMPRL